MIDYTGDARFPARLTPTSQSGGNLIQPDLAQAAMTAPGSEPTDPLPPPQQGASPPDHPQASPGTPSPMPVNWPQRVGEHAGLPPVPSGDAADLWRPAGDRPSGTWVEL